MDNLQFVADCMNVIADFVGPRDVQTLSSNMADVAVLFGGSIVAGGDVFAEAMQLGVAKTYVIVGGAGHTTQTLRNQMRTLCPKANFQDDASEAEVFASYLNVRYGLAADYLETHSTNCGNNITFLLDLMAQKRVDASSIVLIQDATMQRRMAAGLALRRPDMRIINYAAYHAHVCVADGQLVFADAPVGMWDIERYRMLLMGEVPRLTDDKWGYGPQGRGFIAHVDVPPEVTEAFDRLRDIYPESVRTANPVFAGPLCQSHPLTDLSGASRNS